MNNMQEKIKKLEFDFETIVITIATSIIVLMLCTYCCSRIFCLEDSKSGDGDDVHSIDSNITRETYTVAASPNKSHFIINDTVTQKDKEDFVNSIDIELGNKKKHFS